MEGFAVVVVIGGFVGLIVGIIMLQRYLEQKRREAMEAYAQANGYVVEADTNGFQASMQSFKLFNQGHSRRLTNLLRGSRDDVSISLCDYKYTVGYGKHQQVHLQTICVLRSPKLKLPHFFARRQVALFDFLGKMFGGQDVNFDEDPAFSKAFVLQSVGSEDELRRAFDHNVRAAFTALAGKSLQAEGFNDTLLYHIGRRLKPEQINEVVDDALALRRTFR